jgi:catechol 2,3-dioxygenase-like lactoylglutathione lyase family enzyme
MMNKMLQRSLLSAIVFVAIVLAPQLHVHSQAARSHLSSTSIQLAQTQPAQAAVVAVESVGMTVSNMDQAVDFYATVLNFKKISDIEVLGADYEQLQGLFGVRLRIVKLQLGNEQIELTEYLTPKGRPIPIDSRSHDRWFQHIAIVVSDMDRAYQHLRNHKVQHTSTAPQRIPDTNKAAAGIRAFYFKDPDGHNLEIIYFPPGKGDPKWQAPSNQLFLGIDHTAIVVSNTKASLTFYRDLLGLKLAGESLNSGTEQEHLNNVQGARLQISGLRAPHGPGIEFLDYLQPKDGRSRPPDAKPNDLLHWQTTIVFKDLGAIAKQLKLHRASLISPTVVMLSEPTLGFRKAILIRDPDGHPLRLVQK